MKALLLAAGLGTRLRPLTETIPKPLVPIDGKPLLQYHLDHLAKHGVTEVLINTHYLASQIETFVKDYQERRPDLLITTSYEETMLGSAGTLRANQEFFGDEAFFIVYADNLTDLNYQKLMEHHRSQSALVTIASYQESFPEQKGIIEFNPETKLIEGFIEKPPPGTTSSDRANAGIYVTDARLFPHLDTEKTPYDFGFDVFPQLLASGQPLAVYLMQESILDVGTHKTYTEAQTLVKRLFSTINDN